MWVCACKGACTTCDVAFTSMGVRRWELLVICTATTHSETFLTPLIDACGCHALPGASAHTTALLAVATMCLATTTAAALWKAGASSHAGAWYLKHGRTAPPPPALSAAKPWQVHIC
mmetsp:Transcript_32609/g.72025  ORF Transcript_32609/g.72025 Transcript_32609/m.72025 type:complete len:117 (+) Transcript_32609:421-771(+)